MQWCSTRCRRLCMPCNLCTSLQTMLTKPDHSKLVLVPVRPFHVPPANPKPQTPIRQGVLPCRGAGARTCQQTWHWPPDAGPSARISGLVGPPSPQLQALLAGIPRGAADWAGRLLWPPCLLLQAWTRPLPAQPGAVWRCGGLDGLQCACGCLCELGWGGSYNSNLSGGSLDCSVWLCLCPPDLIG